MWTQRPKGGAPEADQRAAVRLHDVDVDNTIWSKFRIQRPDGKDVRVNVHRFWRDEVQQLVAVLGQPAAAQPPAAPPAQPPAAPGQFSA
jgi:hypothetical protein